MKMRISIDEWYPIYECEPLDGSTATNGIFDFNEGFIDRYQACMKQFWEIQNELIEMAKNRKDEIE